MWYKNIDVELQLKGLRIGDIPKYDVDLPTLNVNYASSSIKGILRKAAKRVLNSINIFNSNIEREVFGSANKEGKIQITVKSTNSNKDKRYGIKIDPKFGSAKQKHLFLYEYVSTKNLNFSIKPMFPLRDDEVLLIYYSLNFLRYESLGGFGSRGFGLIENVRISDEFRKYIINLNGGVQVE